LPPATVIIGARTHAIDREQLDLVLSGQSPFDETTMIDEHNDYHPNPPESTDTESDHSRDNRGGSTAVPDRQGARA
jgi:hypothetical protein